MALNIHQQIINNNNNLSAAGLSEAGVAFLLLNTNS
jgi:hypothetical protein